MPRPPLPDCYDYVRRYYGVPAYIGVAVKVKKGTTEHEGILVAPKRADQYVHVLVKDATRVDFWHPLEVTYRPVADRRDETPIDGVLYKSVGVLVGRMTEGDVGVGYWALGGFDAALNELDAVAALLRHGR